jgi:hypothetical protein
VSVADIARADPAEDGLVWNSNPCIWGALAIARHYGVPTRLIDWTRDVFVAAYFAACSYPRRDGVVWWFSQADFENALNNDNFTQWENVWNVHKRPDGRQRAIEEKSFDMDATPWVPKVHHENHFPRMELQDGFFTSCGRLDRNHDEAMEILLSDDHRGRVTIRRDLKRPLLDHLERIGVHAQAIDYPGADIVGFRYASTRVRRVGL